MKKGIRGIRAIERSVQKDDLPLNQVIQGYCSAVRSAITDDGRPPLCASGLKLRERLTKISQSINKMSKRGYYQNHY